MADLKDAMPVGLQHARGPLRLPRGAQVRRHRRGQGATSPPRGPRSNDIDGVRVQTADGWWLARASNTQAVLVVRAEAGSPEGLERLKGEVRRQLGRVGIEAPAGF